MPSFEDLVGQSFGCYSVTAHLGRNGKGNDHHWACKADCGQEFDKTTRYAKRGGCRCQRVAKITASHRAKSHGGVGSSEYASWKGMKARCLSATHAAYARYGGRGITVCDRWKDSFENFFEDMGSKPGPAYSIERNNNDGNYEPLNCRWATDTEQALNRRNVKIYSFRGETHSTTAWSRKLGGAGALVEARLNNGWTLERALSTPANKQKSKRK